MPGQGHLTRSAFGGTFLRLLTFDMVAIEPFYMRFGLFKRPGQRPMLVMGNIRARYSFWDLQRFEERATTGKESTTVTKDEKKKTSLAKKILIKRIRARGNATLSTNERDQGSSDSKGKLRYHFTSASNNILMTWLSSSSPNPSACPSSCP